MAKKDQVRVVTEALDRFINDAMKKLMLDLVAILAGDPAAGGTPIDTGWASANWIPYLQSPRATPAGLRPVNASHGMNNASRAEQEVATAAVATLFNHKRDNLGISNQVPYIVDLNEGLGTSKQASPGFVQRAVLKVVRNFRNQLKLSKDVGPDRQSSGTEF